MAVFGPKHAVFKQTPALWADKIQKTEMGMKTIAFAHAVSDKLTLEYDRYVESSRFQLESTGVDEANKEGLRSPEQVLVAQLAEIERFVDAFDMKSLNLFETHAQTRAAYKTLREGIVRQPLAKECRSQPTRSRFGHGPNGRGAGQIEQCPELSDACPRAHSIQNLP